MSATWTRWRRRRAEAAVPPDPDRPQQPREPAEPQESCRFVGVRGPVTGDGLYEFFTPDGIHVTLHETDCLGLTYTPGPEPTLTARFRFDPDWTPPQLVDRPVVVLRFLGAHVLSWETDADEEDVYRNPAAPGGQVSDLEWDGGRIFALNLLTVYVIFTAHTAEVTFSGP